MFSVCNMYVCNYLGIILTINLNIFCYSIFLLSIHWTILSFIFLIIKIIFNNCECVISVIWVTFPSDRPPSFQKKKKKTYYRITCIITIWFFLHSFSVITKNIIAFLTGFKNINFIYILADLPALPGACYNGLE